MAMTFESLAVESPRIVRPVWADYRVACVPHATGCRQCGRTIPNRRAYCSEACSDTFQSNHFWNTARYEAIRLSCPAGWTQVYESGAICRRCQRNAWWQGFGPEVNHIVPVNGKSRTFGCCNHQDNLEVLCRDCHLKTTAEQRRLGLIGRPRTEPPLLAMVRS